MKQISILLGLLLLGQSLAQNVDTGNYTKELFDTRSDYCKNTSIFDNILSEDVIAQYRIKRKTNTRDGYLKIFEYYENTSSLTYIKAMKMEAGLLLTITCLCFLIWMYYIYFCCNTSSSAKSNNKKLQFCTLLSWLLVILVLCLFILAIIFNAFMEIYGRRARCQLAVVSSFIINGYLNESSGN